MMTFIRALIVTFCALALIAPPLSARCIALEGGTLHTPDAVVTDATLVMSAGKIQAIGKDLQRPDGCERIDVSGGLVTAGFVHPHSSLGLVEVGLESASVDVRPDGAHDPVHPSFEAHQGYNPDAVAIPVSRVAGITSAVIVPRGGIFSGWGGWVDLAGKTHAESVLRPRLAQYLRLGAREGGRGTALHRAHLLFEEAKRYAKYRGDWEKNKHRGFRFPATELEAVLPILSQKVPLVVHADRASDIEAALRLAERHGLRMILSGAAEAWRHAIRLAETQTPVIVDPIMNAPENFDRYFARADSAAILAKAGVPLILTTSDGSHNLRKLTQAAGNAIRAGLPHSAALDAITRHPADAFGMPEHGRLSVGATANVVVWSGDPFEFSSAPTHVFIHGRSIDLVSRQTRLRDRYRELPGTPSPALSLPGLAP